jgi:hypothetical protein
MSREVPNVKGAAKELLLEEYKAFSSSLDKNEQSGETRTNWFIGIITAGVGGLAKIFSDGKIQGWPLRLISVALLLALLTFGIVTFSRIIKRNKRTDELIHELEKIRELFREHFDGALLANHRPFRRTASLKRERAFGGLADLVLTINSLVAAALVAAPIMPIRSLSKCNISWLIATCLFVPVTFVSAFCVQRHYVRTN